MFSLWNSLHTDSWSRARFSTHWMHCSTVFGRVASYCAPWCLTMSYLMQNKVCIKEIKIKSNWIKRKKRDTPLEIWVSIPFLSDLLVWYSFISEHCRLFFSVVAWLVWRLPQQQDNWPHASLPCAPESDRNRKPSMMKVSLWQAETHQNALYGCQRMASLWFFVLCCWQ